MTLMISLFHHSPDEEFPSVKKDETETVTVELKVGTRSHETITKNNRNFMVGLRERIWSSEFGQDDKCTIDSSSEPSAMSMPP